MTTESGESTTICSTLKLQAADGKMRMIDVADTRLLVSNLAKMKMSNENFKLQDCNPAKYHNYRIAIL
jgi:hypothetical protein